MSVKAPEFIESEYFVAEFGNWHLLPGAPEEVVKEFEEYMEQEKEKEEKGLD
jgi:hypothetical protein